MAGTEGTANEGSTSNAPVATKARDIQNYFGQGFSSVAYRNLIGENEFEFIKSKILYAFYGPPVILTAIENVEGSSVNPPPVNPSPVNPSPVNPYVEGYDSKKIEFITPIYEKICEFKKYSPRNNNICMSILFVCVVPHDESKSLTEHADILSSQIANTPVFKIRKCIKSDVNDVRLPCCIYVDEQCRVYSDWKSYLENNKLPKGVMVVPKDGRYQFSNDDPSTVLLEMHLSPQSSTSAVVAETLDTVSLVSGFASMGVFAASLAIPVAGPIIAGAVIASTSAGAYGIFSSGKTLRDRYVHEQSISLLDPQARGCWISVAGSSVGIITAGATQALSMAARNGAIVSQGVQRAVNVAICASIGTNFVGITNGVFNIIYNYAQDGQTPSKLELLQLTTSIFFFCHSTMNLKTASSIIEETQNSTLNQERDALRSNRHRKMFDKMAAETRRQAGGSQQGNAEVIRSMRHISNKDDFFASALRMNKEFNANKVKVSFSTDGSMKLNANNVINPKDLISLQPGERAEFLSNIKTLNLSARNYSTAPNPVDFSHNFSYSSALLLVKFLQSQESFRDFITEHIADFVEDNLNRLAMIVHGITDDLPPNIRELLESNMCNMFEDIFKFVYKAIHLLVGRIEGIGNFTDALSLYFVNGNLNRDKLKALIDHFISHIQSEFLSDLVESTCNVCGGTVYG